MKSNFTLIIELYVSFSEFQTVTMRIVRSRTFWRGIKQARNTSYDTSGTTTTTNGQTKLSMIKGQRRGSELDTGQQKDLSITVVENTPILLC